MTPLLDEVEGLSSRRDGVLADSGCDNEASVNAEGARMARRGKAQTEAVVGATDGRVTEVFGFERLSLGSYKPSCFGRGAMVRCVKV